MTLLKQDGGRLARDTVSANGAGSEDARVRVGVVGLGYWGPNLVRVINESAAAEAAWICDLRPEALDALGRRFPAVRQTQDVHELLADESVDAVAVVTPVSTHHDLAMRALNAGKHVFVEKPLASSSDLAVDLIDAAYDRGLVLMPGHTFLYSPPVNRIRELIRAGELGEIYFISMSRVNLGLYQSDVSVIWDLGPHDFSILLYWLDERPEPGHQHGPRLHRQERGRGVHHLRFDSGTIAHVELSWLAPSKLRRTTVVGSKKMVVYDDCSNEPVRVLRRRRDAARPRVVRRVPQVSDGRHRVSSHREQRADRASNGRLLSRNPRRNDAHLVGAARARRRAHDRGRG